MKTVAFLPIRLNSKRVVGKNLKLLGNKPLMTYLLETIKTVKSIDEIYVFCSSEEVKEYLPEGIKFLKRSTDLDSDETLGAEIYNAFVEKIDADIYILAHTTSPFIKSETIERGVAAIKSGEYDSAFSAEEIKTFAWYHGKPINYDLTNIPRTQDLDPIYIETSAFFMFRKEIWVESGRRIGEKPYVAVVDKIEGVDIDTMEDFSFAQSIIKTLSNE